MRKVTKGYDSFVINWNEWRNTWFINLNITSVLESNVDGYDSDLELMLDPGYAECADAIKGL